MIQKFFRNIARKRTESELDNLISRFSSSDIEEILILHQCVKTGPQSWRLLLTEDYAEFFDKMCHITNDDLDEESKKKIATYTWVFIQLQKESREDPTIFCFWFWKVIFNTMLMPELDNKVRDFFKLVQSQSVLCHVEMLRMAEEVMGQKPENIQLDEEDTLYYILPEYYK
jgi:hypothetical protein